MPDKEELYDEAMDVYADDKFDEAIELYKQAFEIDPKFADAMQGMSSATSPRAISTPPSS